VFPPVYIPATEEAVGAELPPPLPPPHPARIPINPMKNRDNPNNFNFVK
jgi:hypothetical protein